MNAAVRTVITAAGDSRGLFLSAGFASPKSLVRVAGKEVLRHAIDSYSFDTGLTTVAINSEEDESWALRETLGRWYPDIQTVNVPSSAKGALISALFGLTHPGTSQLVVAAGDSSILGGIKPFVESFASRDLDAATIVFPSREIRWSYLSVGRDGEVDQVAEKKVIGPWATTGVFYFKTSDLFLEAAQWCLVNNANYKGNYYVSATLNYLISVGRSVGYEVVSRDRYRTWSLPVDFSGEEFGSGIL